MQRQRTRARILRSQGQFLHSVVVESALDINTAKLHVRCKIVRLALQATLMAFDQFLVLETGEHPHFGEHLGDIVHEPGEPLGPDD